MVSMSQLNAQFERITNIYNCVLVWTDLSSKAPHGQVGVGRVVTSGSLGSVMVSVLVYTCLSGKAPHGQVGVGRVVT